ncbi:hypothetical protein OIDMADRAFT_119103 [Oidiodendron maius Zn]|uniref:Rhodopsin domain-containing protein n=1 Tax=Oidiodendron maius (strain Zn) TaxID=913774 RepID=A0A0C3HJH5_OIDMZ|nr:hypothetical protein OIDMADRAFT_119103 [Oidiodendron maius Zn]
MTIQDRGPQVEAVAITFLILSWIAVCLRCYVKLYMIKLFKINDWLAVLSLASFTFFCTVVLTGEKRGTGRHIQDISKTDFSAAMMWWFCGEISYITTTALIKATIGMFLLQICTNTYQKCTIWIVIIVSTAFSLAYIPVLIFQCYPISYFWTRFLGGSGKCLPTTVIADMMYTHGVISTWSDWTLGILPGFLVRNLNMSPRTKVSVALILGLGALGSTASIVRFPYIHQLTKTSDFLWDNTDVSIWSTVEPGIGIVASSMATMRPLFVAFFSRSKLFGTTPRGNTYPRNTGQFGFFHERENISVDEIELHSDIGKTIRVTTTVTNTQSSLPGKNRDAGTNSSESERALKGEDKWGADLDTHTVEDVGYRATIEARAAV